MSWTWHNYLGPLSIALWLLGALLIFLHENSRGALSIALGGLVTFIFIIGLWLFLERPPLRTMGETRLWYAFFCP
ncbi:MAG: hypothetical protein LBS44_03505 [Deltaproteobacteria bacterium]|nr:hypothetical protein [Deltaproteobacteria bacterium]